MARPAKRHALGGLPITAPTQQAERGRNRGQPKASRQPGAAGRDAEGPGLADPDSPRQAGGPQGPAGQGRADARPCRHGGADAGRRLGLPGWPALRAISGAGTHPGSAQQPRPKPIGGGPRWLLRAAGSGRPAGTIHLPAAAPGWRVRPRAQAGRNQREPSLALQGDHPLSSRLVARGHHGAARQKPLAAAAATGLPPTRRTDLGIGASHPPRRQRTGPAQPQQ